MKSAKNIAPFLKLGIFYLIVNLILRIILIFHPITQSTFGFVSVVKMLFLGVASDFFVFTIASVFLWLYLLFLSDSKYHKPWGCIIFGILTGLLIYISFFNTTLNEYGGVVPTIGVALVGLKTLLFGLLLFFPKYRKNIRLALYSVTVFIFVLVIIQNAVSEFFFWNEFGVKYNFIAVDYLVYTNTVIGNIMESYPVVPLFIGIGIIALASTYVIVKKTRVFLDRLPSFKEKIQLSAVYVFLFIVSLFAVPFMTKFENSQNVFVNELQANGVYKFYLAFMNSELDYEKFYKAMPEKEAYSILKQHIPSFTAASTLRAIQDDGEEIHKNVMLITVESLSADFLKTYGNEQTITPFLDSLANESLLFTNLYATGNRTVRGLEAVTLCIPPTAGESVVKREDNKNKFSTGSVFKQKGYDVKYLYGGDAYFDNMESFFGGNGYEIVDKKTLQPNEISFENIWGVCDEDMAKKAIKVMNEEAKSGKPFFNHWMTVSNHRPFTYPENKIDIPANSKSREGGVKYTDYALNQFFKMAEKQSWFKNTVFVIVADHCASSSGKTELPMEKYRIPAMIYAPGFIKPKRNQTLMSQIDLMPTLFGLLNFDYQSKFYGEDIMKASYDPRAFIATYQDLGLIKDDKLTIISPVKKVKQFDLVCKREKKLSGEFQIHFEEKQRKIIDKKLVNEAVSYYETASEMLKNKKYQKV
ncbi:MULTISPECIES: alkaline phosphatase family protein [Flavobacterium]|uniref:alkaline phosphatase family protein n=1 Tax=Flavobacterium TaxID=237 RepID=UPI001FCB63AD|nr:MULTISPECIES: alkaline phosphatase family protein [Flavobacterium]UOK41761.1 sulfatase-like hydrolase/transferase [Flavobacterium enshiense]